MITVNSIQARAQIALAFQAGLVPMLHGSPGIGKSALMASIAKEFNLELIDIRLAQIDPTELNGFPVPDYERRKASYIPMDIFPIQGDPLPKGKDGWLIFFDEINSADRTVQKACYKVIYDRMIGGHKLHKNVVIAGAGNLSTDNAIVEDLSTALQSRLSHLRMVSDLKAWLPIAYDAGIHHYITDFLQFRPDALNNFDPNHSDLTFACERTWFAADKIIKHSASIRDCMPILAGTISEGIAREFEGYCEIYGQLPKFSEILNNPKTAPVPTEPGTLFALTGSVGAQVTQANIDKVMPYIKRLPIEFQVITIRAAGRKDPDIKKTQVAREWIKENATELY